VTFGGATDGQVYTAENLNGKPYDVATGDAFQQVTFDVGHSTSKIAVAEGDTTTAPVQTNATPTGELTQEPTDLSVDVSDADFGADENVTVTIDWEGSQTHQETLTANSTVTTPIPEDLMSGQSYTWTVNTTDAFGNTNVQSYSFHVPGTVFIYNETLGNNDEYQLITSPVDVEATITGDLGTVQQRTVTSGEINLTNLPPEESYIITVNAENYSVRSVFIDSLYDQSAIFMLPEGDDAVENLISVTDRTGRFSENPVLKSQRVINASRVPNIPQTGFQWLTVSGDRLGADGQYNARFAQNQRYRFVVENVDGDTRVLGEYTAQLTGTIDLEIGEVQFDFGNETAGYLWDASVVNESTGASVQFAYEDFDKLTSEITVTISTRDGEQVAQETFTGGPYGQLAYTYPINQTQYEETDYEVSFSAVRDGETITQSQPAGGQRPLNLPLDQLWLNVLYALVTLMLAFVAGGGVHPAAGAVAASLWGGLAWYLGLVPPTLGAGAVILALAVSGWMLMSRSDQVGVGV